MLQGIDVSSYQGRPDWATVRASGRRFAAAKATEGTGFVDPSLEYNWPAMKKHGLYRLAYHFLHTTSDGTSQAHALHQAVHWAGGWRSIYDAVLLDLEDYGIEGQTGSVVQLICDQFISEARRLTGRQVILYTGRYVLQSIGGATALMRTCPLWVAEYGVERPTPVPGWPVTSFWQYSGDGSCPGVQGLCDLDVFLGNLKQLRAVLRSPAHHTKGRFHAIEH